jgi:ferredoxin
MDAVVGMEGNGPGSGDPVKIGALLASPHALALDTVTTALVGLSERQVWTQRVARESGRPGSRLEDVTVIGPPLAGLRPKQFRPAPSMDIGFGLPAPLKRTLRNALTARPAVAANCVRCGDCVRHCPPHAMTLDERGVSIDYHQCIRCFCCQELCPHGAILTRQGTLLRVAAFLGQRR